MPPLRFSSTNLPPLPHQVTYSLTVTQPANRREMMHRSWSVVVADGCSDEDCRIPLTRCRLSPAFDNIYPLFDDWKDARDPLEHLRALGESPDVGRRAYYQSAEACPTLSKCTETQQPCKSVPLLIPR